jgi:two-component system chemotaxis response regulator CheB
VTPGLRILVAETSPLYRGLFAKAAESLKGASVAFAHGYEELLETVRRGSFGIVAVECDILGKDFKNRLQAIAHELPKAALLVTVQPSRGGMAQQEEISAGGAAHCLVKLIYGSYGENLDMISQKLAEMVALSRTAHPEAAVADRHRQRGKAQRLVLVAASTGGQQALEALLPRLNGDFPAPILIVLHMPAYYTESVAASLNKNSVLTVRVAQDCERVEPGAVYIAPGGVHMTLSTNRRILLEDSAPINGVKPSADALFNSAAESGAWQEVLAVILTGMGKDGSKGLARLKARLDCQCIAQSERTCTVYGMPKAAVDGGLADKVLDLQDIAHSVETFAFSPLPQGDRCR